MQQFVALSEINYPSILKKINDPPKKLFYLGKYDKGMFRQCLAVVGSRKMTNYGESITKKLVRELASSGITIVSGFMTGIDITAHKAALDVGGSTVAVMPCGIDLVFPEENKDVYYALLDQGGLVISELEGSVQPRKWTFVKRNRIVAGLCQATFVVEAVMNSGSLITAKYARKYKRKLFAVPGNVSSSNSEGTLQLIKEGAQMVTDSSDILDFYGIDAQGLRAVESFRRNAAISFDVNKSEDAKGKTEKELFSILSREPQTIDDLTEKLDIDISQLIPLLTMMQLNNQIIEIDGEFSLCM